MFSQKIPRTWQIYSLITYHPSLLEASVTTSPSNLPDRHAEVVVEERLQPPLHQQEFPYFNQACNCSSRSAELALENRASGFFSVSMSTAGVGDGFQGMPILLLHGVCH